MNNNAKSIKCAHLNQVVKNQTKDGRTYNLKRSLDGSCFQMYSFELESLNKELKGLNFEDKIEVQTIFRIPKKYFYHQMAEQLSFSTSLTT